MEHSAATIARLRQSLAADLRGPLEYLEVYAIGSYGRGEATEQVSDFEWLLVYDDSRVHDTEAQYVQRQLIDCFASELGRENLSINKTFGALCTLQTLRRSIGGLDETNQQLTYRMLLLTEGVGLTTVGNEDMGRFALAQTYGAQETSGHRLLSLASDICRYYRAARISYKYKVDELGKPWGVRAIKMRSSRRMAYVSSALQFVAFGPRTDYGVQRVIAQADVFQFMACMADTPVLRLVAACEELQIPERSWMRVISLYEQIHRQLGEEQVREHLDGLSAEGRFDDELFEQLRAHCSQMHTEMAKMALIAPEWGRQQLVEMFLL